MLYVLAYAGFAYGPHNWWGLLIAFTLAGSGIGLPETAESTLVARILPIDCAAADSVCSGRCRLWATSCPRLWWACSTWPSPLRRDSHMPPLG